MRRIRLLGTRGLWRLAAAGLLALVVQACSSAEQTSSTTTTPPPAGFAVWDQPKPVPEVSFVDGAGQPRSLADFEGKVVLLNLWATWCGPCREEMPSLDRLQAQLGSPDFEVVALSLDQAGEQVVRDFYREIGIQHLALYIDQTAQAGAALNALGIPTTLLLDRQGREVGRKLGAAEWDSPEVVAYLSEVIEQNEGQSDES